MFPFFPSVFPASFIQQLQNAAELRRRLDCNVDLGICFILHPLHHIFHNPLDTFCGWLEVLPGWILHTSPEVLGHLMILMAGRCSWYSTAPLASVYACCFCEFTEDASMTGWNHNNTTQSESLPRGSVTPPNTNVHRLQSSLCDTLW